MKKFIFCALALSVFAVSGCNKNETGGSASVGDNSYTISSAYAYQASEPGWSNIELILCTSGCYLEDGDVYGDYFYVDLYWDEEVRDNLIGGTYTLGGDVLDEVAFDYDDPATPDIDAVDGSITISGGGDRYDISFSGTAADGSPMSFSYSGPVVFMEM